MQVVFKCRKCRTILLSYPGCRLLNAHGHELHLNNNDCNTAKVQFIDSLTPKLIESCSSLNQDVFYIDEINVPEWISDCIDKGEWTRGKLMCPICSARLGSFDFVSGFHCACQASVVPSIHLVKSKVDYNVSAS